MLVVLALILSLSNQMVMSILSVAARSSNLVQINYQARPSQIKEQIDGRIQKLIEIFNEIQSFK